MHIYDLDTPALVVDLDVLERNIREMAARCDGLGISLRAHTKTHKVPEIAHMQVAAGSQLSVAVGCAGAGTLADDSRSAWRIPRSACCKPARRHRTSSRPLSCCRTSTLLLRIAGGGRRGCAEQSWFRSPDAR